MKKLYLSILMIFLLVLTSCLIKPNFDVGDTIKLKRVAVSKTQLDNAFNSAMFTRAYFNEREDSDYVFGFQGTAPLFDVEGKEVQANDIAYYEDYVIIAYNLRGNEMQGAIQIFDSKNMEMVARAEFPGVDINSVIADGSNIIFAGSTIINNLNVLVVNKVDIRNFNQEQLESVRVIFRQFDQEDGDEGIVVTSIEKNGENYYFSLADENGKIIKTNNNFTPEKIIPKDFIKDLKFYDSYLYALQINEDFGNIIKLNSDLDVISTYAINSISDRQAKASLSLFEDNGDLFAVYTRQANGFEVYNLSKDELIFSQDNILVNGVFYDSGILFTTFSENPVFDETEGYIGTGGTGLQAYEIINNSLELISKHYFSNHLEGSIEGINVSTSSSNFLMHKPRIYESGLIFAATGKTGLFVYEFINQESSMPVFRKENLDTGHIKLLPLDDENTPEIILDFIFHRSGASPSRKINAGIFNYYTEDLPVDVKWEFDFNSWEKLLNKPDEYKILEIFSNHEESGVRLSFDSNFRYLGFYLEDFGFTSDENAESIYTFTNLPGLGDPQVIGDDGINYNGHIKYYMDTEGNNGKGQIIVGFDDGHPNISARGNFHDVIMIIRAYHKDKTIDEIFEIVPFVIDEIFQIDYLSTGKLINEDISVPFNTAENDVISLLDETVVVYGTYNNSADASITWEIDDYNANIAGEYIATGTITLPEDWFGVPEKLTVTVTVEEEIIDYVQYDSTGELQNMSLSVVFGTSKSEAISQLDQIVTIFGTNDEEASASITWEIDDYNSNTAGEYYAIGTITLPNDWQGDPNILTVTVTVEEEIIHPEISEFAQFVIDNNIFVYGDNFKFAGNNINGQNATMYIENGLNTDNTNLGSGLNVSKIYFNDEVILNNGSASLGSSLNPEEIHINGNLELWIGGRSVYGDVYVNGNLRLKDAKIYGNIYVDGDVELGWTPTIAENSKIYYTGTLTHPNNYNSSILSKLEKVDSVAQIQMIEYNMPELREDNWYAQKGYVSSEDLKNELKIFADSYTWNKWNASVDNIIIIAKDGDINITGMGGSGITGILIAPKGKVVFQGAYFKGIVITRDGFEVISGGTEVTFKPFDSFNNIFSDIMDYPF